MNKKINIFTLFLSLLLIFTGCSFLNNSGAKNTNKDVKPILITGTIQMLDSRTETVKPRTASTSYIFSDSITTELTASRSVEDMPAGFVKGTITDNTYSIVLDASGKWSMYLNVYLKNQKTDSDDLIYVVSKTINVTSEGKILDEDDNQLDSANLNFYITPDYSSIQPGSINLKIKDETGKIKKVSYFAQLQGGINSNSLSSVSEVTFENNEATISRTEILPNRYDVTFEFTDEMGNTLYSCWEIINVVAGFATDTWIGNGAHLKESDGKTEFVITNDLIEQFGADVVPNTKYALFSTNNSGLKYYVTNDCESVSETPTLTTTNTVFNSCFDNDGNLYLLTYAEDGWNTVIMSDKTGFSTLQTTDTLSTGMGNCGLMVDHVTNIMYAYSINENSLYIYKYPKLIAEGTLNNSETYHCSAYADDYSNAHHSLCCINNGIVYDYCSAYIDETTYSYIAEFDLSKGSSLAWHSPSVIGFDQETVFPASNASVADIIYQDGNVYLLFKESSIRYGADENDFAMTSRGAIIKYSLFTRTFSDPLGWTDTTNGTVFKYGDQAEEDEKFLPTYSGNPVGYSDQEGALEPDEDLSVQLASAFTSGSGRPNFGVHSIAVDTPLLANLDSQFSGPQKFIAVKPKKLVIADSGIAFYTDAEGIWKYKNINRVVTVDLDSFMIDSNLTDSPTNFKAKTTRTLSLQSSDYAASMVLGEHENYFYNQNGEYNEIGTAYAGITNGDE